MRVYRLRIGGNVVVHFFLCQGRRGGGGRGGGSRAVIYRLGFNFFGLIALVVMGMRRMRHAITLLRL